MSWIELWAMIQVIGSAIGLVLLVGFLVLVWWLER